MIIVEALKKKIDSDDDLESDQDSGCDEASESETSDDDMEYKSISIGKLRKVWKSLNNTCRVILEIKKNEKITDIYDFYITGILIKFSFQ